ncbi:MAG: hypothetical protein ABI970_08925 [Chloroflexota bacterium]
MLRDRNNDANFKAGAVTALMSWRDIGHPATDDAVVVRLQPFDFLIDLETRSIRSLRTFERNLKRYLHLRLPVKKMIAVAGPVLVLSRKYVCALLMIFTTSSTIAFSINESEQASLSNIAHAENEAH